MCPNGMQKDLASGVLCLVHGNCHAKASLVVACAWHSFGRGTYQGKIEFTQRPTAFALQPVLVV